MRLLFEGLPRLKDRAMLVDADPADSQDGAGNQVGELSWADADLAEPLLASAASQDSLR